MRGRWLIAALLGVLMVACGSAAAPPGGTAPPSAPAGPFSSLSVPPPTLLPGSNFTFEENFNSLDTARWTPIFAVGDPGFGLDSNFLGNLSKVSIVTSGGDTFARITATKHAIDAQGRTYDSACFGTMATFSQLYGIFEARVRYSAGQGVWPAFWMLQDGLKTTPPEIDVLEAHPAPPAVGGSGVSVFIASLHTILNPTRHFTYDAGSDLTGAWHRYKVVWRASYLQFFIDDIAIGAAWTADIPNVAMYPILNLALGESGYRADGNTPSTLTMDIDWVRVSA